jgi:flagellar motor switch/type III secretory pathway protein FliN
MAAQASAAQGLEKPAGQVAPAAGTAAEASGGEAGDEARWGPVLGLPCELMAELPVPDFKIADLLMLRSGSLINVHWRAGHDVPLRLNGTLIGWSELEVLGNHLAVRLTELA